MDIKESEELRKTILIWLGSGILRCILIGQNSEEAVLEIPVGSAIWRRVRYNSKILKSKTDICNYHLQDSQFFACQIYFHRLESIFASIFSV